MRIVTGQRCDGGLAPQEHTIAAGGMDWHYLQWGTSGPPLVLWHGVTSDARNWWRVGPLLAGLGFQVYAADLPGHGLSGDAPGGYGVANTALLLDAWMAALDIVEPVLIGHSWGGLNAIVHASQPDARVHARALVLEDPAVALWPDPGPRVTAYTEGLGTPRDEASLAAIAAANPRWHECDVWWKAQARQRARHAAVEGFLVENAGIDVIGQLLALPQPTLLLLGDPDYGGIWPTPYIAQIRSTAPPTMQVEVLAQGSHNPHRDSFIDFSMTLGTFVRRFAPR